MHHNSTRCAEPLTEERQAKVLVTISRCDGSASFDQMLLHVCSEIGQQLDFLVQRWRMLIHCVVVLVAVALDILNSPLMIQKIESS